jgi:hypothetical protein
MFVYVTQSTPMVPASYSTAIAQGRLHQDNYLFSPGFKRPSSEFPEREKTLDCVAEAEGFESPVGIEGTQFTDSAFL